MINVLGLLHFAYLLYTLLLTHKQVDGYCRSAHYNLFLFFVSISSYTAIGVSFIVNLIESIGVQKKKKKEQKTDIDRPRRLGYRSNRLSCRTSAVAISCRAPIQLKLSRKLSIYKGV